MFQSVQNVFRVASAALLLVLLPAAAQAAVFAKYDGIDGEAVDRHHEVNMMTTAGDVIDQLITYTGLELRQISLMHNGRRLAPDQRLMQVRGQGLSCRIEPPARSGRQKQRQSIRPGQPAGFCYQKIIWTVRAGDRPGVFHLIEVEEDMPRR